MSITKERLDILVVKKHLVDDHKKAKGIILAGLVYVNGHKVDKPGTLVSTKDDIIIKDDSILYVSRGGLKLEKALKIFDFPVNGKVFLDVGASTGGFTHCLLLNGAKKVYAIDVGYGQLAWTIRQDPRVVVMERTNIRYAKPGMFKEPINGAAIDVSFISLKLVLPVVKDILVEDSHIITLIKPQFEARREKVGPKGVVRDPRVHQEVLTNFIGLCQQLELTLCNLTYSPITGPEGNIEFLAHIYNGSPISTAVINSDKVEQVIKQAHEELL